MASPIKQLTPAELAGLMDTVAQNDRLLIELNRKQLAEDGRGEAPAGPDRPNQADRQT